MEIAVMVVLGLGAVVVLGMVVRVFAITVRQSRNGYVPTEQQRTQIMVLGALGVALALLALLTPELF